MYGVCHIDDLHIQFEYRSFSPWFAVRFVLGRHVVYDPIEEETLAVWVA